MSASLPRRAPSILVVEDEVLIRLAMIDELQDCGFKAFGVGTASEAMRVLKVDLEIDAVITDVNLPGEVNGVELARWIKVHYPFIPVVVASAHAPPDLPPDIEYFSKPFHIREIAERLAQRIKK